MNVGNAGEADRDVFGKSGKCPARLARLFAVLALAATAVSAWAVDPSLTFSGTLGGPITITLETPVVYVATVSSGSAPAFIFKNVGSFSDEITDSMAGNITFSINGGAAIAITGVQWGLSNNDVTPQDLIFFAPFQSVAAGDVITLSAGFLTVENDLLSVVPTSGTYETFISNEPGQKIGAGSAVPEPQALTLAMAGLAGLLFFRCGRRPRASAAA